TRFSRDWSSDVCSSDLDVTNNYSSLQYPGENRLGTWFIDGDTVWLEYFQPAGVQGTPILQLSGVIHGYRLGKLHAFLNAERGYRSEERRVGKERDCRW